MPLIIQLIDSVVPAYYALILRSLTVLEGLALYADPDFKVLAAAYPYFAKRLLTDPNPYLRDALIELLFKDGKFRLFIWAFVGTQIKTQKMKNSYRVAFLWCLAAGGIGLKTYLFRGEKIGIFLRKMLCSLC